MHLNLYLLNIRKVINIPCLYVFIIMGMLTSCTTHIAKPSTSWAKAKPVLEERCPDVSGLYQNQGIDAANNKNKSIHQKHPQYLSRFLIASLLVNGRKHKWITHVELSGVHQGKLTVLMEKQGKNIYTSILQENKNFTCTKRGLEINSSYMPSNPMGITRRSTSLIINKAVDGSLIISEQESEAGLFIALPYKESITQYFKFPAID